jgi:hypothetical protein
MAKKTPKKNKTPIWILTMRIGFLKEADATKAHNLLADCLETKFKGIKYKMLPAYHPDDVAFKNPKAVAAKHKKDTSVRTTTCKRKSNP